MINKNLLYNARNSTQYSHKLYGKKNLKKNNYMYMYNWIILVYLKLTHCKPTTLQCKIKVREKKKSVINSTYWTHEWCCPWKFCPSHKFPWHHLESASVSCSVCLTLYDTTDCSPPGSSVRGILHARILEWVAISFSRRTSWPRDQTQISCIAGGFFTNWVTKWPKSHQLFSSIIF